METTTQQVVVGFTRVSTMGQVADGDGLAVQRERIEGWCRYQGLPAPQLFEEAGVSGSASERPGLRQALRAALALGPRCVFLTYKLDRIGRTALDVQEVLAVLADAGVRVVAIADGVDSGSGMGGAVLKLLTNLLASIAEIERETIKVRLLDGRNRANAEDRPYGREPKYGRRVVAGEGRLVLSEDELIAMNRIREMRADGVSVRRICAVLDAEGVKPRRAAHWSPAVVHRIATGKRTPPKKKATPRVARFRAELLGPASDA